MHMYHDYESVYEYGSNAFELLDCWICHWLELLEEEDRETYGRAMVDMHCIGNNEEHKEHVMKTDTDESDDEHE